MDGASLLQTFVFVASLWRRIGGSEKAANQATKSLVLLEGAGSLSAELHLYRPF